MESFVRSLSGNIEPHVQHHLKNVYATVTIAAGSAAMGAFVHLFGSVIGAGLMTGLGSLACLLMLCFTPHDGKNQAKRLSMLAGFGFFSGVNLGPLLEVAIMINPTIVMEALLGTTVVFGSFSLSALYAPRGRFLYLGGSLFSILNTLFCLSLFNMFVGSYLLFQANLYIGLFVMCGFIVYDTQMIMEKCRAGNRDYVMHGLELFIDFLAVFKKLLIILSDKEANKKSKRKN